MRLKYKDFVAFDIETAPQDENEPKQAVNVRKNKIIGIGWYNGEVGGYITDIDKMKEFCYELMEKDCHILAWNAFFDLESTLNYLNVDLWNLLHCDVQLMVHTCDENRRDYYRLKSVGKATFGDSAVDEQKDMEDSIKSRGGKKGEVWKADERLIAKYCIKDCELTYRLWEHYTKLLAKDNLVNFFYNVEVMPQYKTLTRHLQRYGVPIDNELALRTKSEIETDISNLQKDILNEISPYKKAFETKYSERNRVAIKRSGNFLQKCLELSGEKIRRTKTGKFTTAKSELQQFKGNPWVDFALGLPLSSERVEIVQAEIIKSGAEEFNINSKDHLKCLFIDELKEKPLSYTEKTNRPQINDLFLSEMAKKYSFAKKIQTYNKLLKLKSNYIEKFSNHTEWDDATKTHRFYPRWFQWGTTSGRYSGDLMQLPKKLSEEDKEIDSIVIEYRNRIRDMISGNLLGADYTSLEPHIAAHNSGEPLLQECFHKGHDFYCTMAKVAFGQKDVDPDPNSETYTKKVNPQLRNSFKAPSLAKFYGQTAWGDHKSTGVSLEEAKKRHAAFFENLPRCAQRMAKIEDDMRNFGKIRTEGGRVRRLNRGFWAFKKWGRGIINSWSVNHMINDNPECEKEILKASMDYKMDLRTAYNFPNQSLANSIISRSAIAFIEKIESLRIPVRVIMQVHDELLIEVLGGDRKFILNLLKECMENTFKLTVPLEAEPYYATKYGDLK